MLTRSRHRGKLDPMTARFAPLAILVMLASGCYSATPAVGVRCSSSGACPLGQECELSRDVCVLTGAIGDLDAGADGAGEIDAPVVVDVPSDTQLASPPQFRSFSGIDNGATTMNVASPAGVVIGDLLLAHVSADNTTAAQIPTPAGWTKITSRDGDSTHCIVAYYRFVIDPQSSYPWSFPNPSGAIRLMAFRGVDPVTPIDAFDSNMLLAAEQPRAPGITTTQPATMLVVLFTQDLAPAPLAPVPNMTTVYTLNVGQYNILGAYSVQPTAGATGARTTMGDPGPSTTISLALAPN